MKLLRRLLGGLVMAAGILGLILSLAGLTAVWVLKPTLAVYLDSTINTLITSIDNSQKVMEVTGDALEATVESIDALSTMLSSTATSVEDTQPIIKQIGDFMGKKLPATLESAATSLLTAQQGAEVLDNTLKSLDAFRNLLSTAPLISAFVQPSAQPYDPETSLAESLGDLADSLEDLPGMFTDMSANLGKADDNLVTVQNSLTTMSESVLKISTSLNEYKVMVAESKSSMNNIRTMLTSFQASLPTVLNWTAIVLTLIFFWLLAAQVVILSQGWELFQGTADRMESVPDEPPAA
jgi:hypothetical protein